MRGYNLYSSQQQSIVFKRANVEPKWIKIENNFLWCNFHITIGTDVFQAGRKSSFSFNIRLVWCSENGLVTTYDIFLFRFLFSLFVYLSKAVQRFRRSWLWCCSLHVVVHAYVKRTVSRIKCGAKYGALCVIFNFQRLEIEPSAHLKLMNNKGSTSIFLYIFANVRKPFIIYRQWSWSDCLIAFLLKFSKTSELYEIKIEKSKQEFIKKDNQKC